MDGADGNLRHPDHFRRAVANRAQPPRRSTGAEHPVISPPSGWLLRSRQVARIRLPLPAGLAAARHSSQPRRCTERAWRARGTAPHLSAWISDYQAYEPNAPDQAALRVIAASGLA